ncbi:MAG: oligosaccharide flippase family protein [Thermosynechococcaceae cyanobacterium]
MSAAPNARQIAKSSFFVTASYVVAKLSQFISQIFLARLLSPEDFGIWGMVLVFTTLSELFQDAAVAGVLVQRGLTDKTLVDAVYSLGVNLSIIMFGVQALAGFPLAWIFDQPIVWPLTAVTGLVFLIGAGTGSHHAVLQRQMKFRELAIAEGFSGLVRLGGAVIAASYGLGVWSFAIAEIARMMVDAILKRRFSQYHFQYSFKPDAEAVKNVRGYISSLIGTNLAVYVNTNGDNFIVGKLLGAATLGYYNMAYQLAMLPLYALSRINTVNFSVLSQKDQQGQQQYIRKILELYSLLAAPIYGLGFVVAPWLIPLCYGANWVPVVPLFQVVLLFAYSRGFMAILGTALNALNKPQINAAINWVLVPLCIPAFWLSARWGGVMGVAITVAVLMGVGAALWFWIATAQTAGWHLGRLVQPVVLPTLTTLAVMAAVIDLPFSADQQWWLQPIVLVIGYVSILAIASWGRIPRLVIQVVRQALGKA